MNTLSVNLHVGMAAFYRPTPARHRILVERRCFPSDECPLSISPLTLSINRSINRSHLSRPFASVE
eukprot:COSAG05_NODE_49_length_24373_cov_16.162561_37_plen_66_part_00